MSKNKINFQSAQHRTDLLTFIIVSGSDLNIGQVGQDTNKVCGPDPWWPLVLGVFMKPESKWSLCDTRDWVGLGKNVGGDWLTRTFKNNINHGWPCSIFSNSKVKSQELIVAEALVSMITGWKEQKEEWKFKWCEKNELTTYLTDCISWIKITF